MPGGGAFDACILDFDGVLADSMRQHAAAYARVLAPFGVQVRPRDVFQREGQNSRHIVRDLLAQAGIAIGEDEARGLGHRKQAEFLAMGTPKLYAGAARAVGALRGGGLRLGLVTGSRRENVGLILGPLEAQFDAVVADGDYEQPKPSPEPYLAAAARLAVRAARCAVIENAPLGIRAALAAGMACVAIPTTLPAEALRAAGAPRVGRDVEEAAAMVLLAHAGGKA